MVLTDDNLIYTDDFFGRYSYFMTCDTTGGLSSNNKPKINTARKTAYLDFRIDSYDFADEPSKINASVVKEYYDFINGKAGAKDTFEDISFYRSGRENISFALENISVDVVYDNVGNDYIEYSRDTSKAKVYRSGSSPNPTTITPTSAASTDVIILYNVRKYSKDDI